MPREGKKLMERKVCGAHFGKFRALRRECVAVPWGKVARCGAAPHRTVTDEGSPPEEGLTAACTLVS